MNAAMPILLLLCPLIPALVIFFLREENDRLRTVINLGSALVKLLLIAWTLEGVARGVEFEYRLEFVPGLYLLLRVDALSLLFITVSSFLWLITNI